MLRSQGHWGAAFGVVALMAVLGALVTGDPRTGAYAALQKPSFTPSLALWTLVGAAYYCGSLVIVGRLLHRRKEPPARAALVAASAVLLSNELWNVFLFRLARVDLAYVSLFPFAACVFAAAITSRRIDRTSGRILFGYLVWLAFDLWWTYQLTRLN